MESPISQNDIKAYLSSSEEFWEIFHHSLQSPYSSWLQYRAATLEQWKNMCYPKLAPFLNLLFEYPVLKKEYPIAAAQGCILTNYRLIMNDSNSGMHSIPLNKIIQYGWKEIGKTVWDKRNVNYVEYTHNEKSIKLDWTPLDEATVNGAIARNEIKDLNEIQHKLLQLTFFELSNNFALNNIPHVQMSDYILPEVVQTKKSFATTFETPSHKKKSKKIISYSIAAILFFGLFKFCNSIDWNNRPSYSAPSNSSKDDDIYSTDYSYTCKHCGGNGQRLNQLSGEYGRCSSCQGRGKVNKWQFEHQAN